MKAQQDRGRRWSKTASACRCCDVEKDKRFLTPGRVYVAYHERKDPPPKGGNEEHSESCSLEPSRGIKRDVDYEGDTRESDSHGGISKNDVRQRRGH